MRTVIVSSYVLALDVARFGEALAKGGHDTLGISNRARTQKADHRPDWPVLSLPHPSLAQGGPQVLGANLKCSEPEA
jgi:hypothetical protein